MYSQKNDDKSLVINKSGVIIRKSALNVRFIKEELLYFYENAISGYPTFSLLAFFSFSICCLVISFNRLISRVVYSEVRLLASLKALPIFFLVSCPDSLANNNPPARPNAAPDTILTRASVVPLFFLGGLAIPLRYFTNDETLFRSSLSEEFFLFIAITFKS